MLLKGKSKEKIHSLETNLVSAQKMCKLGNLSQCKM